MAIAAETRVRQLCAHLHLINPDPKGFRSRNPSFEAIHQRLTDLCEILRSLETELSELERTAPKLDRRLRVWRLSENLKRSWRYLRKADDKFQTGVDESEGEITGDSVSRMRNIIQLEAFVGQLGTKWKELHWRMLMMEQERKG